MDTELFIFGGINNVLDVSIRFINASITLRVISHCYALTRGNRLPGSSVLDWLLPLEMAPLLSVNALPVSISVMLNSRCLG